MGMPFQPWREGFGPASYRGVFFHVEVNTRASGRRVAMHEYPKRDTPYAEDMGKRARNFRVTGYLVGPDYIQARDDLVEVLELEGGGQLILPKLSAMLCSVDSYSVTEVRERGGYCVFDMTFVETGLPGFSQLAVDTRGAASSAASSAASTAGTQLNTQLGGIGHA